MGRLVRDAPALKRLAGGSAAGRPLEHPFAHIALSWAPGESPGRGEAMRAVEGALDALGYGGCLAVVVAHHDRDHFHVHAAVCRIDPETGRARATKGNNARALSGWAKRYELERGAVRVPARFDPSLPRQRKRKVRDRGGRAITWSADEQARWARILKGGTDVAGRRAVKGAFLEGRDIRRWRGLPGTVEPPRVAVPPAPDRPLPALRRGPVPEVVEAPPVRGLAPAPDRPLPALRRGPVPEVVEAPPVRGLAPAPDGPLPALRRGPVPEVVEAPPVRGLAPAPDRPLPALRRGPVPEVVEAPPVRGLAPAPDGPLPALRRGPVPEVVEAPPVRGLAPAPDRPLPALRRGPVPEVVEAPPVRGLAPAPDGPLPALRRGPVPEVVEAPPPTRPRAPEVDPALLAELRGPTRTVARGQGRPAGGDAPPRPGPSRSPGR